MNMGKEAPNEYWKPDVVYHIHYWHTPVELDKPGKWVLYSRTTVRSEVCDHVISIAKVYKKVKVVLKD